MGEMNHAPPEPEPLLPIQTEGVVSLRVRYCECDPMGVAHHAAYAPWLEIGRTELLRGSGVAYADLEAAGVFLVIVKLEVSYKRPAYYDDVIEVRTRVAGGSPASRVKIRHEYEIIRGAGDDGSKARIVPPQIKGESQTPASDFRKRRLVGEVLCAASTTLACIDRDGRPRALPSWLIAPV